MVRTIKTKIIVMNEGEHVQIEPYGKHIVRVRVSADEIQDLDWTLLPKEESEATIKKEGTDTIMVNGNLLVKVTGQGHISFWNQKGELLCLGGKREDFFIWSSTSVPELESTFLDWGRKPMIYLI